MTTVVCVASGPSLTPEQTQTVEAARQAGRCRIIVVNDNYRLLPDADVLYAADGKWWRHHWPSIDRDFRGECWTQDREAATKYGLCFIQSAPKPGLSRDKQLIHTGSNSGYQAINLAYHFGARRIVLIGYDMHREGGRKGRAHWFGDHPEGFGQADRPQEWAPYFERLRVDLEAEGVECINCTIRTALTWRRVELADVLA